MKKKMKGKLMLLFAGVAALLCLGGCTFRESMEETLANRNLKAQVTYYANGGKLNGKETPTDIYFRAGSKAFNIGTDKITSGENIKIEKNEYKFAGWYFAVDDNNDGIPDTDVETGNYKLGSAVDFNVMLAEGDHWKLVAKWAPKIKVDVVLCYEGSEKLSGSVDGGDVKEYENGEILKSRSYDTKGLVESPTESSYAPMTVSGYTFTEYYFDDACTQPVAWPIRESEQMADLTLYAKYLKGEDWTVVRNTNDVKTLFEEADEGNKYWVARDIAYTGTRVAPITDFNGEIYGNGFTVSGLKIATVSSIAVGSVGLFGNIQATSVIKDISFTELQITYSLSGMVNVYFAFASLAQGAMISNVSLSGSMKITTTRNGEASNLIDGYTSCLFGGFASDAEYTGITVNDGTSPETFIVIEQ